MPRFTLVLLLTCVTLVGCKKGRPGSKDDTGATGLLSMAGRGQPPPPPAGAEGGGESAPETLRDRLQAKWQIRRVNDNFASGHRYMVMSLGSKGYSISADHRVISYGTWRVNESSSPPRLTLSARQGSGGSYSVKLEGNSLTLSGGGGTMHLTRQ